LKISNLCNHNTSTLRTDRQTDGQTTCHSNTALCVASRGKNRPESSCQHQCMKLGITGLFTVAHTRT